MRNGLAVTLALVTIGCAAQAASKPAIQTSFNYFTIVGTTPREIYADLLARGPQVGGMDALATTKVDFSQAPQLAPGPLCKMKNFGTRLTFKVSLPHLAGEAGVSPSTRASWARFASELKAHEAHHRAIWTACANRLERQVMALKSESCENFKAAYADLSRKNLAVCEAENQLFDAKERLRFLSLPFIRQVTKTQ